MSEPTWDTVTPEQFRHLVADELESDKWVQIGGYLAISGTNERCCLGVACEVAIRLGANIVAKEGVSRENTAIEFSGRVGTLPRSVQNKLGFRTDDGRYEGGSLVQDNDTEAPFPEIADKFRSCPPGLLKEDSE